MPESYIDRRRREVLEAIDLGATIPELSCELRTSRAVVSLVIAQLQREDLIRRTTEKRGDCSVWILVPSGITTVREKSCPICEP